MLNISSSHHLVSTMKLLLWFAFAVGIADSSTYFGSRRTLSEVWDEDDCDEDSPDELPFDPDDVEDYCRKFSNIKAERRASENKLMRTVNRLTGLVSTVVNQASSKKADVSMLRRVRDDPVVHDLGYTQLLFENMTTGLSQEYGLSLEQIQQIHEQPLEGEHCKRAKDECMQTKSVQECNERTPYRTADGTCNNLKNPRWGSVRTCYRRILPACYEGGNKFRESVLGGPLPLARDLSTFVHGQHRNLTSNVNLLHLMFGQLLAHDTTQTAASTTASNSAIQCCPPSPKSHPQCAPIIIRPNDYFYSQFGTTCMNFVRSAICPTCTLGARQQMNQVNAFLDASFNYDHSTDATRALRTLDGTGHLLSEKSKFGEFLPSSGPNDFCSNPKKNQTCFRSGDSRVNQQPVIAAYQTIFMREHNRVADCLRRMNPTWDDETLFQEAKRVVCAILQNIVYKEYLPSVIGNKMMDYFDLWPLPGCKRTCYDEDVDPSILHEHSTAAFRFGHSMVSELLVITKTLTQPLRDAFFESFILRDGLCDPLISGLASNRPESRDRHMVGDVSNFLYRLKGSPAGLDLASINIQRGRDHGLPPYVKMAHFCCDKSFKINCFEDLVKNGLMAHENMLLLKENYGDVDDIDLWTGILNEIPLPGAVTGRTGACIIGLQFYNLKYGDRFYFEHGNQAGSFTCNQLKELKKTNLLTIMCQNTNLTSLPRNAMHFSNWRNPMIDCKDVKGIDFSHWKVRHRH